MSIAFIVPVLNRFDLFTGMMNTVDHEIYPIILDNWNVNRGVAPSWNEGMRRALDKNYTYAVISNDDVWFEANAIKSMLHTAMFQRATLICANVGGGRPRGELHRGAADFCCFLVNIPQLIDEVGFFDENFRPAYFEDNDMHRRLQLANSVTYLDTNAVIHHHGSATQNHNPGAPIVPSGQFEANRNYYISKWGGNPGQEIYTNPYNDPSKSIKDWN